MSTSYSKVEPSQVERQLESQQVIDMHEAAEILLEVLQSDELTSQQKIHILRTHFEEDWL